MPGFSSVKYNNLEALEAEFKKDADNIAAFMVGYIYICPVTCLLHSL